MTRTARRPHQWVIVATGLVAVLIWSSVAVRALVMDQEPSAKTLLACTALVLVGFVLGPVTWILSSSRREKRPAGESRLLEEMKATYAMLGIMLIGLGAGALADPSPSAWDLALMAITSLVGGLNVGVSFIMIAAPGDASGSSTSSPTAHLSGR